MKVLSLFDGMACGMLAMQSAGLPVDRYVAFEIDKYAVQTSSHNFPIIEHRGDVFQADFTEFRGFDFLVGGSPCTYWSIAKTSGRETEASGMGWELFSQYVRALREAQPMWFIYENNKSMAKAIRESITGAFGFEPICINSALVSAQNRQRLYWVGRRNPDGTYRKVHVEQPEDRGILLKDVLRCHTGCASLIEQPYGRKKTDDGKYDRRFEARADEKANALVATRQFQFGMVAVPVKECANGRGRYTEGSKVQQIYEARDDGKCNTLTTVQKDNNVCEPVRIGTYPSEAKNQAHDSQQYRIYSTEGKSVNLCGNGGGMGAKTGLYALPVEYDGDVPIKAVSGSDGKTYDVYQVLDGKITIKGKQYPIKLRDGYYIIRKLTVSECKRLQTVPEWYEFPVSDTQAFRMLGNGWTVLVISHLIQATQTASIGYGQLNLFEIYEEVISNAQ